MKLITETGRLVLNSIDERGRYRMNRFILETGEKVIILIVYRVKLSLVSLSKSISQKLYNTEMILTKYIRRVAR